MRQFSISIHSFEEVQSFVSLAMTQPFAVLVGNDRSRVNGKNFMGMLTLDYNQEVQVRVDCDEASFLRFRADVDKLLRK